jgi:hypothetical protein
MIGALLQRRGTHHVCVWVGIIGHVCPIILDMLPQKTVRDTVRRLKMCHLPPMINQSAAHLFYKTLRLSLTNILLSPKLNHGLFVCKRCCLNVFTEKFHKIHPGYISFQFVHPSERTNIFSRFEKLIEIFNPQY